MNKRASNLPDDSTVSGDAAPEPANSGGLPALAPPQPKCEPTAEATPGKQTASKPVECPLTIGQVQRVLEKRLGFTLSINALERWCRKGKIYAIRLGPEWRIPRQAVEEIIKAALNGERF